MIAAFLLNALLHGIVYLAGLVCILCKVRQVREKCYQGDARWAWIWFRGGCAHEWESCKAREKGAIATMHARGTFEVKVNVQKADNKAAESANLGRMSIEKQFHGDLEGRSAGEMLSVGTEVKGSAGYVAMERVNGTLHGRTGTFALQHSGTMTRGEPQLSVTVVPDSGAGQLVGIAGKLTIKIADGKHFYEFEFTLPETP
jgi:hypothetical protein